MIRKFLVTAEKMRLIDRATIEDTAFRNRVDGTGRSRHGSRDHGKMVRRATDRDTVR